jgi:hypothetical protein
MRPYLVALFLAWSSLAMAGVINVEFKFTPFVGDPAKSDTVETVPGKASVYVNNVPITDREISKREVPVLFKEREISPSIWVPMHSIGPVLRKGKNTIRIEFEPTSPKAPYRAQLRWAQVTDQTAVRTEDSPGRLSETNQTGEGVDDRKATGRVVFEREFVADFAKDLPWHHYPAVTALSDDDRKALAKVVKNRADWFKPDFAAAYRMLQSIQHIDVPGMKKMKCLPKGYAAGVRVGFLPIDQLDFVTTGNPEVVIRAKAHELFFPLDPSAFDRIKDDEVQRSVMFVFSLLYPPRLVVVRSKSGTWEVAY